MIDTKTINEMEDKSWPLLYECEFESSNRFWIAGYIDVLSEARKSAPSVVKESIIRWAQYKGKYRDIYMDGAKSALFDIEVEIEW